MQKLLNGCKLIWECFIFSCRNIPNHHENAGYLAFVIILSMFPFLLFFVSIISVMGKTDLGILLYSQLLDTNIIPSNIIASLQPRINEIISGPPQSLMNLAIIGIIWTSSSIVEGLRNILNQAYRVESKEHYIIGRLTSILYFFIIVVILLAVIIIYTAIPILLSFFTDLINHKEYYNELIILAKSLQYNRGLLFCVNSSFGGFSYLRYVTRP